MDIQDPFEPYTHLGPRYSDLKVYSLYIPVRDGTRLAADVYLPDPLPSGGRVPTILYQTRYWRSSQLRAPFSRLVSSEGDPIPLTRKGKQFFCTHGYALVYVDVRGTGASFGVNRYAWEAITVLDAYDLIDWIVAQPWSDGSVAGTGISFVGNTAELLLATAHPALKAVIPMFNHPDPFTDIAMPGGLFNQRFIRTWAEMNEVMDRNQSPALFGWVSKLTTQGVHPVGGVEGKRALQAAIAEHAANGGVKDLAFQSTFRDDRHPVAGYSIEDQVVMRFRDQIMASRVPVLGWASWLDAGTANAALRRFMTYPGPQSAVIGAWNHGGINQSSPYQPGKTPLSPSVEVQNREMLRFLDDCLHPERAKDAQNILYYYTLGTEIWQKTTTWPPPGFHKQRWYLGAGGALLKEAPKGSPDLAFDRYLVDFRASTGIYNRWWELGVLKGRPVDYGDRSAQKPFVLGYESTPLERDIEITGTPVLTLYASSTESDCAFYAFLEDVFPDGTIRCLADGQLRAVHRKVSPPEKSPYRLDAPYHSFLREDAQPLIPGETAEITFGLLPVSACIQKSHRIRLSLAGHDDGNFPRCPEYGNPVWTIFRGESAPSSIELPVKYLP